MLEEPEITQCKELECCPTLECRPNCDTLDFNYRLPWMHNDLRVELILRFRLRRCSGPLVLGDLAYSTTLLPGEKVKLFTSDRHTRWSFDSKSQLSYRKETTSEESFYTKAMAQAVSDLNVSEFGFDSSSTSKDSSTEVSTSGLLETAFGGARVGKDKSYDASSSRIFMRSLSKHASSASRRIAAGVRSASATSIGEVEHRVHKEGESEAHYESSSRVISNPNHCHAVTYYFYKINKVQTITFQLVAIERQVVDKAAPTYLYQRSVAGITGGIDVRSQTILATDPKRIKIEQNARIAASKQRQAVRESLDKGRSGRLDNERLTPIAPDVRRKVLEEVDRELIEQGILAADGEHPSEKIIAELSWKREEMLPTPGLLVKGCLDDCNICEPGVQTGIKLDLERRALENELLKRKIELLDQAREYRCCPVGEVEEDS